MSENKQYENEYKVQAVKLAKKIGAVNAANELQIPVNTLYGWIRKVKIGSLDIGCGERSPEESLNIAEENQQLRKRIKALEKGNKRLSEMNAFWRMQRLFSLPAVRNRERTKADVYCNPDR
ncbi:MAG: transposase [Ruminococcus callidus]